MRLIKSLEPLRSAIYKRTYPVKSHAKHKSTLGAINDGLRRTQAVLTGKESDLPSEPVSKTSDQNASVRPNGSRLRETHGQYDSAWVSIPYTSATSEWIYGHNSVVAALRARRREIYHVYVFRGSSTAGAEVLQYAEALEKSTGRKVLHKTGNEFLPIMDKISQGRPHNGVVLEASPIPTSLVSSLSASVESKSPRARQPGTLHLQNHHIRTARHPLVLFLDGIEDPGNLGNIIRTSLFYGVDAICLVSDTCAPINNPITVKASSGAIEVQPIYFVDGLDRNFVERTATNGWEVLAAVAPRISQGGPDGAKRVYVTADMQSPLGDRPCMLMLGSEGHGLSHSLVNRATANIVISGASGAKNTENIGLDSLNVASAAAALLESLTRVSAGVPTTGTRQGPSMSRTHSAGLNATRPRRWQHRDR